MSDDPKVVKGDEILRACRVWFRERLAHELIPDDEGVGAAMVEVDRTVHVALMEAGVIDAEEGT